MIRRLRAPGVFVVGFLAGAASLALAQRVSLHRASRTLGSGGIEPSAFNEARRAAITQRGREWLQAYTE